MMGISFQRIGQRPAQKAYTLVEVMVVLMIIVLVVGMSLPIIQAMQKSSARSGALNAINAALQAARSYAIMNQVKTAARFQPNGKIVLVYRFEGNINIMDWGARPFNDYPAGGAGTVADPHRPNAEGYVYLPAIDRQPLTIPEGYAVISAEEFQTASRFVDFVEPFYVCYNPNGSLATHEPIWVALTTDDGGNHRPVNPNFDGDTNYAWNPFGGGVYSLGGVGPVSGWIKDTTEDDAGNTDDVDDRKIARYYYVATSNAELTDICDTRLADGIDYYAGRTFSTATLETTSVSSLGIFKTPDNWKLLPLFDNAITDTKCNYVEKEIVDASGSPAVLRENAPIESIYISPHTGRMIRPTEQ